MLEEEKERKDKLPIFAPGPDIKTALAVTPPGTYLYHHVGSTFAVNGYREPYLSFL